MPPDDKDIALGAGSPQPASGPQDTAAAVSPIPPTPAVAVAPAEVTKAEPAPAKAPEDNKPATEAKTAAPAIPEPEPTLLEQAGKDDKAAAKTEAKTEDKPATEAKPDDKKTGADKPAAEGEQKADAPKADPVEYKYTLPDTLKMSDEQKTELHTALDSYRSDQANVQPLIDLHNKLMGEFVAERDTQTLANQHKQFAETRKSWRTKLMADPDMGGAAFQTTSGAVARMRDLGVSTAKEGSERYNAEHAEFNDFLRVTGAGDHPAFWRMLHNFARWLDEPPAPAPDGQPPKGNGKNPRRSGIYSEDSRAKMNA